jgi:serpin B
MEGEEARPSKKLRAAAANLGMPAFALRAAKHLAAADDGGNNNLVFSPVSIYAALALVAAGARGATLDELLDVLGARSLEELVELVRGLAARSLADLSGSGGGPLVAFACGVWHDETVALKPDYRAAAVEVYNAETRAVDFMNKVRL